MELTFGLFALGLFAVIMTLVLVVMWPPAGFALVLSIPLLKFYLRTIVPGLMQGYTYDMAVVLIAFVGVLVHRLRHGGRGWPLPAGFVVCWFTVIILMWLHLPVSRNFGYGYKKSLIFSIFITFACGLCPIFLTSSKDARRVLRVALGIGIVAAIGLMLYGKAMHRYTGARTTLLGASPLGVADACVHLILIAFCFWLAQRKAWQLLLVIATAPIAIFTIIKTGTRAGLVFPPLVLFAALWMYRRRIGLGAVGGTTLAAVATALALVAIVQPQMLARFQRQSVEESLHDRADMARITLTGFLKHPLLGHGTGDTSYQLSGGVEETHPHNHILEIANELGVFGLMAYLGLIGYGMKAGWRMSRRDWDETEAKIVGVAAFACFLYHFLVGMKGGSYSSAYLMYFFLTITVVIDRLYIAQRTRV